MSRSTYVYVGVVALAASVCLLLQPWPAVLADLPLRDVIGIVGFIGVGILSEVLAVDFPIGPARRAKTSIAFLPLSASAILFPGPIVLIVVVGIFLFAQLIAPDRALWKILFNVSQGILSMAWSVWVYEALGGTHSSDVEINLIAFIGLSCAMFVGNLIFVSGFYSIRQGQNFFSILRYAVSSGGGNLLYALLASPISIFAAILYRDLWVGGLVLFLLPLLLIRYSYLSKVQLQEANRDLLRVLVKAIETRDPYTSGHSVRVANLARTIAEDLSLPKRVVDQIETAALLHDIGKIDMLYAAIIHKDSSLTEEERRIIQTHATIGADILQNLTSLEPEVIKGVRHHHERFDGSGYPDGLAGTAIPIAARIIMLCDSVDAMLSDRPYRPALTLEQARAELIRCAATQFDPAIVEVVIERKTLERAAALSSDQRSEPELVAVAAQ